MYWLGTVPYSSSANVPVACYSHETVFTDGVIVLPIGLSIGGDRTGGVHTSLSGKRYSYNWGSRDVVNFSIGQVSAGLASVVNSFWSADATCVLQRISNLTEVYSGRIANAKLPVGALQDSGPVPSTDYQGSITLESF